MIRILVGWSQVGNYPTKLEEDIMNFFSNKLRNPSMIFGLLQFSLFGTILFAIKNEVFRFLAVFLFFLILCLLSFFYKDNLQMEKNITPSSVAFMRCVYFYGYSIIFTVLAINAFDFSAKNSSFREVGNNLGAISLIMVIICFFITQIAFTRFIKSSTEKSEIQTRSPQ
jgi:hypothetical protein